MRDKIWDSFLEGLAKRLCLGTTGKVLGGDLAAAKFVLKETVLPLLEAGQALADMQGAGIRAI